MKSDILDNCRKKDFDFAGLVLVLVFCISALTISTYVSVEKAKKDALEQCKIINKQ